MTDAIDKPAGRDAVMVALVDAAGQLILERGMTVSVRDIAQRAGVDHGLVRTYFGGKEALLSAAIGHLVDRAAAELDENGFPPADLAFRRGGEVARALARTMLDEAVIVATTLGLGWALFAEHLCGILDVDEDERDAIEQRVLALVSDIGGIPNSGAPASSDDRSSD